MLRTSLFIIEEADNAAVADFITEEVRAITAKSNTSLHVSIAGGRKTMGFYIGYALSLFGRAQDRLSHVLVTPPFESLKEFFYPAPGTRLIRDANSWELDAKDARVYLGEIPFVRLKRRRSASMRTTHRRYSVFFLLFLFSGIAYLDRVNMSVAGKPIAHEFGLSPIALGYLFSSFLWAYVLMMLPGGRLIDRWGPHVVASVATAVWSMAQMATGMVGSFAAMLMVRLGLGVGEAPFAPISYSSVRLWSPATTSTTRGPYEIKDDLLTAPPFGASAPTMIEEVGFALDSSLEGGGFELPVPRHSKLCVRDGSHQTHCWRKTARRGRGKFADTAIAHHERHATQCY